MKECAFIVFFSKKTRCISDRIFKAVFTEGGGKAFDPGIKAFTSKQDDVSMMRWRLGCDWPIMEATDVKARFPHLAANTDVEVCDSGAFLFVFFAL